MNVVVEVSLYIAILGLEYHSFIYLGKKNPVSFHIKEAQGDVKNKKQLKCK